MGVVAEGVETRLQRDRLVELGCPLAQGFFFDAPLEPAQATARLSQLISA
jgi:EAL domain-containing protein (putative c-di-GMP-specific phosphodiesterase class I)